MPVLSIREHPTPRKRSGLSAGLLALFVDNPTNGLPKLVVRSFRTKSLILRSEEILSVWYRFYIYSGRFHHKIITKSSHSIASAFITDRLGHSLNVIAQISLISMRQSIQ